MSHLSSLVLRSAVLMLSSAFALGLSACAEDAAEQPEVAVSDETGQAEEDLSAWSRTHVGIRRDYRKCISPLCGGYWVHDLNRKIKTETYVSSLDFKASGLDEQTQALVLGAADGEIVLRAKLGPKETKYNTRTLQVAAAYRGLPGRLTNASDQVYAVENLGRMCITSPCPTYETRRVNYSAKQVLSGLDLDLGGHIDAWWLLEEAARDGALVLGSIRSGQTLPGGVETILDASQVFLKLPEVNSCPQFKLIPCPTGTERSYSRNEKRCILPGACVPEAFCKKSFPVCDDGYSLVSWTGESGCEEHACDPTWIFPEQQ